MKSEELNSPLQQSFSDVFSGAVQGGVAGAKSGSLIGTGIGVLAGAAGGFLTGRANDAIEEELAEKEQDFNKQLEAFTSAELTNPFAGLTNTFAGLENPLAKISTENKFEDLTVNLKSADYQRQMAEESQAAILQTARAGAGGAGGIASIAGLLAKQNAQVRQQIAADIGSQEAQNERLKAQGAENARQVEMNIGRAQLDLDKTEAQAGMTLQQLQAQGAMDTMKLQEDRKALALGFQAQQLASDTEAATAETEANNQLLSNVLSSAPDIIEAFS
tara:strand:- start:1580 stop:2404 length:825 start_codon:yes stop_codon:yes gene_type:complete